MTRKGLFIVTEGIDGSGKTTQAGLLAEWVFNSHKGVNTILLTHEPSDTKYTKEIYQRLHSGDPHQTPKERMLELYVLDREEHVNEVIAPALAKGQFVICDRYKYSTIAYQSAQGILTSHAISENAGFPIPDLVLFFNVNPEASVERMKKLGKPVDVFEKIGFLEKVKSQYLKLPQLLPNEKIHSINANQSIELVHEDVKKAVKPLIEQWLK
ncbi:MAG: dTMP kinase [archaeon]